MMVAGCVSTVEAVDPGAPDLAKLSALQAWVGAVVVEAAKVGPGSCRKETPGIEQIFPVPGLLVAITTGGQSVSDQFAFVGVRKDTVPKDISPSDRLADGCTHLKDSYLPAAKIPSCTNGVDENGAPCGTVPGGPCADLRDAPVKPDLWRDTAHPNEPEGGLSVRYRRFCKLSRNRGFVGLCRSYLPYLPPFVRLGVKTAIGGGDDRWTGQRLQGALARRLRARGAGTYAGLRRDVRSGSLGISGSPGSRADLRGRWRGRWRKRKGKGTVRLRDGSTWLAEPHWYEAHGIGRRQMKIKRFLE